MQTIFVAAYPWWPISDPVITFAKFLVRHDMSFELVAEEIIDFVRRSYPTEDEFETAPATLVKEKAVLPAALADRLEAIDSRARVIFFDEASLESCGPIALDRSAEVLFYSTELPTAKVSLTPPVSAALQDGRIALIIQDRKRLELFCNFFSVTPKTVFLAPNANIPEHEYHVSAPDGLEWLREKKVLLMTGSLIAEHAVLEMTQSFLDAPSDWFLFINGWGTDLVPRLKAMIEGKTNAALSTKYLSGPEVRWLYTICRAGIVSYANQSLNHRHCGLSSGKLFWLTRYGKPVVCNDNESISAIVQKNNLGLTAGSALHLEVLDANYETWTANCREFYEDKARSMADVLAKILTIRGRA